VTTTVVGAVVLNWNQERDTAECLASLRAVAAPAVRVVLVDNGSPPDSVDRLERGFPEAAVVRLPDNRGFAAGNNVGIVRALELGVSHVLLLNNDTIVDPKFLPPLIDALDDGDIGVTGPKIFYHPDVERIWFAGGMVDWGDGRQYHLGADELDDGRWDTARDVDYVTACCLLARAETFHAVGTLDERYFIYFEETDWNFRVRRRGLRRRYVPTGHIYHKVSRAMKTGSPASDYYYARNRLLFLQTHAPVRDRVRLLMLYTARSLRYAATLRWRGRRQNAWAITSGVGDFYRRRFGKCPLTFGAPAVGG
jgi:GT2 family glycosyltransferase